MAALTTADLLDRLVAPHAARPLLVGDGFSLTYAEALASARGMAARLVADGLKPGDRVLVTLDNGEGVLRLYLAAALAGLTVCPVDPGTPPARLAQLGRDLAPRMTIDAAMLATLEGPAPAGVALPDVPADADFLILFSSGTTGDPKGIVHSLTTLTDSARAFAALSGLSASSVIYHHFPMFYMAGVFNLFFCPLVAGATIVVGPKFSNLSMMRFWDLPRRFAVNHLTLTPTMALWLSQLYRRDDGLLDHLSGYEAVISTGSALYESVARRFLDTFQVPLRSCYGVTEIGGSVSLQGWDEAVNFEASCGPLTAGTEVRAGSGPDAPAEIRVRTPFMMKHYLVRGAATPAPLEDGFFRTGDIGYVESGILHVTGRSGDTVKKGGEFVSTVEVESLALGCPQVTDAAVVAVPDEYWGNRIVLFYVPQTGMRDGAAIEEALSAIFTAQLRRIEHPDKMIPVPFLPKTSIGKTVKRVLVERYTI